MKGKSRFLFVFSALLVFLSQSACAWLPGGSVVESATVVYTTGSSKHTAAVQIPVPPAEVFAALVQVIERKRRAIVNNRNDKAYLIEVSRGSRSMIGQVTELDPGRSLLYVWTDTGESGISGVELTTSLVELVCDELGVGYNLVKY